MTTLGTNQVCRRTARLAGAGRDDRRQTRRRPFSGRSQQNIAPGVYRVGTLAESVKRCAVLRIAAQRLPAAMLYPFSLGSARKGQRSRSEKEKTAI